MKILNARPEGMSFEDYREHLVEQKKYIKRKRLGMLVWATHGIPEFTYIGERGEPLIRPRFLRWLQEPMGTFKRPMLGSS